jgi:hypothetical protein
MPALCSGIGQEFVMESPMNTLVLFRDVLHGNAGKNSEEQDVSVIMTTATGTIRMMRLMTGDINTRKE